MSWIGRYSPGRAGRAGRFAGAPTMGRSATVEAQPPSTGAAARPSASIAARLTARLLLVAVLIVATRLTPQSYTGTGNNLLRLPTHGATTALSVRPQTWKRNMTEARRMTQRSTSNPAAIGELCHHAAVWWRIVIALE